MNFELVLDSIYWVITHNCNDRCDHCYNGSAPKGVSLTEAEASQVVANFPSPDDPPKRIIISGGEPLVVRGLLYHVLDALHDRYGDATQYMLQTNGDLLKGEILDELIERHVTRIDIASIDRFHREKGARAAALRELMESRGMVFDNEGALVSEDRLTKPALSFSMWGSNEDFWIGGNWPRGRAISTSVWLSDPDHNFCAITSGAKGFAGTDNDGVHPQELAIQLYNLYPCCPGTKAPLADLRNESLTGAVKRVTDHPMWAALNRGEPWKMGEYKGISESEARRRTAELGSVCLWCDEFFAKHYEGFERNISRPHRNLHDAADRLVQIDLPVLSDNGKG